MIECFLGGIWTGDDRPIGVATKTIGKCALRTRGREKGDRHYEAAELAELPRRSALGSEACRGRMSKSAAAFWKCRLPWSLERRRTMKHLFAITVLVLTFCSRALSSPAGDERELTQLVKDLNAALVKVDIAFLENLLHKDYTHYRPSGVVEDRVQYLKNRKTGRVDFESLVVDQVKVHRYGDIAIVTYRSTAKGKDQQGAFDERRRWTRVFLWQGGRWRLLHSQGTTIQKP
jgi:ketosteroid isomerase-like protein